MQGSVIFFSAPKGWGFIKRDDGGADLFVHHSAINAEGYRTLKPEQRVEFDVVQGEKGPQAEAVTVIDEA